MTTRRKARVELRNADALLPEPALRPHDRSGDYGMGERPMAKVTNDLIFENLKALRRENADTRQVLIELRDRVSSLERGQAELSNRMAGMEGSVAGVATRLDRVEDRLYRVERRLELVD